MLSGVGPTSCPRCVSEAENQVRRCAAATGMDAAAADATAAAAAAREERAMLDAVGV
jgi:hypothetical protein